MAVSCPAFWRELLAAPRFTDAAERLIGLVLDADHSIFARSLVRGLENTGYFTVDHEVTTRGQADDLLASGAVQFVVTIPAQFGRSLVRGDRPVLLVEADATDPSATGNAIAALEVAVRTALARDLQGPLAHLNPAPVCLGPY